MSELDKKERKVSWSMFVWALGVFTLLVGYLFTSMEQLSTKVDVYDAKNTDLRIEISKISADIVWIREKLSERQIIR